MHRLLNQSEQLGDWKKLLAVAQGQITILKAAYSGVVTRIFIDSVWLHKFWGCHRISDRSFFLKGRQFHVCARCTGLLAGLPFSLLLFPVRAWCPYVFIVFSVFLLVDGFTQFFGWRNSNNKIRFITGMLTASTFLPTIITIGGF